MARTISTKLAIEGESQFKQSVSACNSELSVLKSNLKLVESEFRGNANSMEALSAKGDALHSMYEKQQEKVKTLEDALKNAQKAQEEYSFQISESESHIAQCQKALDEMGDSAGDTAEEQKALTEEL